MAKEKWGHGGTMMCTPFRTEAGAKKFIERMTGERYSGDPRDRRIGGKAEHYRLVPVNRGRRGGGWDVCRPAKADLAGARRRRR